MVTDRAQLLSQARRYLEDLQLFEEGEFIAPRPLAPEEALPVPAVATVSPPPAAPLPLPVADRAEQLEAFRRQICECTLCPLGRTRQRFVFGDGNPEAGILFVGEGPGEEEDRQGLPFVGAAGQLLTKIIEPRIICALGKTAAQALLQLNSPLGAMRGRLHQYRGIPVVVTYHPAALLRHAEWKRQTWEDVKWLRREYDGTEL